MPNFTLKTKVFLILLISTIFFGGAYAQTTTVASAPAGAQSLAEAFFKNYKEDTGKAVTELFKTNPLIEQAKVDEMIKAIEKERKQLGAYNGKELISQKKASNSLIIYSYLVKHDVQPVRFSLMFYKPKNEWMIYRFYLDSDVEAELQASAKL